MQLFDIAWNGYKVYNSGLLCIFLLITICRNMPQTIEKESVKKNPGKDQNKVALALNIMRYFYYS